MTASAGLWSTIILENLTLLVLKWQHACLTTLYHPVLTADLLESDINVNLFFALFFHWWGYLSAWRGNKGRELSPRRYPFSWSTPAGAAGCFRSRWLNRPNNDGRAEHSLHRCEIHSYRYVCILNLQLHNLLSRTGTHLLQRIPLRNALHDTSIRVMAKKHNKNEC